VCEKLESYLVYLNFSVLLLLGCNQAAAADHALPPGPYVSTSGEASVEQMPDFALITVSLRGEGANAEDARDALDESATVLNTIIERFADAVSERRLRTVGVTPQYRRLDNGGRELEGYRAEQTLVLQVDDLKQLNSVYYRLAALNTAGLDTPTFHVADESAVRDRARKRALDKARGNARMLASSQGAGLGQIWGVVYRSMHATAGRFSTGIRRPDDVVVSANMRRSRGLAIPLEPQPITYTATVGVVYRLDPETSGQ